MLKSLIALTLLLPILYFFNSPTTVKADDISQDYNFPQETNIGDFIYEDNEYLTQNQVDRIERINRKIFQQKNSQNITLFIVDKIKVDDIPSGVQMTDRMRYDSFLQELNDRVTSRDYNRYNEDNSQKNWRLHNGRNILVLSIKDKRILFQPETSLTKQFTDLKFWQVKMGILGFKYGNERQQIDSSITLMERLSNQLLPIAKDKTAVSDNISSEDIMIKLRFIWDVIKTFFSIVIVLAVMWLILKSLPLTFISSLLLLNFVPFRNLKEKI